MPVRDEYRDIYPSDEKIADVLLVFIRVHGGDELAVDCKKAYAPLADYFDLSDAARRLSRADFYVDDPSRGSAWANRVQWARNQLVKDGYLSESRQAVWKLSTAGKSHADRMIVHRRSFATAIEKLAVPQGLAWKDPLKGILDDL